MGISINLKVPLADLISTSKPHLQQLPSNQLSGIADCSVSSVSIDAISIQQDSTQVNMEVVTRLRHFPVFEVLLSYASLHHPLPAKHVHSLAVALQNLSNTNS